MFTIKLVSWAVTFPFASKFLNVSTASSINFVKLGLSKNSLCSIKIKFLMKLIASSFLVILLTIFNFSPTLALVKSFISFLSSSLNLISHTGISIIWHLDAIVGSILSILVAVNI